MQSMKKAFIYFALLLFVSSHQALSQDEYPSSYGSSEYESSDQPASSSADSADTLSDISTETNETEYNLTAPSATAPSFDTAVNETSSEPAPVSSSTMKTPPVPAPQPASPATVESQNTSSDEDSFFMKGIGIQSGVRFHDPDVFNEFVTAFWNTCIEDYVYLPADDKRIGPGVFLTLNGSFDLGDYFQVAPFMQGMWAGKWFYFRGGITKDLYINTYTAMGGVNLWGRLTFNRFSVRLGIGGYGAYTIAKFSGDIKVQRISGKGYGFRGLVGSELRLNEHFVLTFDCSMPFGISKFKNAGSLKTDGSSVEYPTKMEHSGFEIIPGVLFYF